MSHEPVSDADEFHRWTAEEVVRLRQTQPLLSVWRVVLAQVLVGLVMTLVAYLWSGRVSVAQSVAYGGLSVVLPAALFARGMTSRLTGANVATAATGFLLWELVKIGLTVAMLFMAGRWIEQVSWPAMLAGFVVTMKVYWVILGFKAFFHPKVKT